MKLHFPILVVLAAAIAPLPLHAQAADEPSKAVQITLHPMPSPRPALKYQLLPSFLDRKPGNAAVWWYHAATGEYRGYFNDLDKQGGAWEKTEQWMQMPLGSPQERDFHAKHPEIQSVAGPSYGDMVRAARCESCDWQQPLHEGNAFNILLPEMSQLRTYGQLLAAKARLEIVKGDFDEAIDTLQTGFALARHTAAGQTLVHALVATAIAGLQTAQVEQFIQQPESPNLYWALSTLPRPLIDYRPSYEVERFFWILRFPELKDLDKENLSAEEWRELLEKMFDHVVVGSGGGASADVLLAMQGYPMAKQYLIEHGRRRADVETMPVAKVILIYSLEIYQDLHDNAFRAALLPYAEGEKWLHQADKAVIDVVERHEEIIPFAASALQGVGVTKTVETRMEWNVAQLRILEALRIYAAAHEGKLPERLEDITEVPIPRNPFDDKPFDYRRDGNRAVLDCQHGPPGLPWRYEITMLPKGEKP